METINYNGRTIRMIPAAAVEDAVAELFVRANYTLTKDVTVYAVAGDRGTLLAVAKAHGIPIPFDCGDGECGSCLVEVKHLAPGPMKGLAMTEKEKEALRQLGKVTRAEIEAAEVNDRPPRHRLACQHFVRDEDILVSFEGDLTLPAKFPAVSPAAPIFRGQQDIGSVAVFLAYAVTIEEEAARHFEELSLAMAACGNDEVAALFEQLGRYSRRHWEEARARAEGHDIAPHVPGEHVWPDLVTPEQTALWAGDAAMSKRDALKAALAGERLGFEFYHHVAETTRDPDIRALAKEFVKEEAEHVRLLERWIEGEATRARQAAE